MRPFMNLNLSQDPVLTKFTYVTIFRKKQLYIWSVCTMC